MCTLLDLHLRPDMQAPLCFVYRTQHHIDPPMLLTHVTVRACLTDCTSAFMNCLSHLIVSFLVFFPSMILPPRGNLFFYVPLAFTAAKSKVSGQRVSPATPVSRHIPEHSGRGSFPRVGNNRKFHHSLLVERHVSAPNRQDGQ